MTIKDCFNKIIALRILFLVFRFIITTINTIIGFFVLSMLLDKIFPLPIIVFHIYWFIILAVVLIFFINLVLRIIEVKIKPYNYILQSVNKYVKLENKDDIINAFLLEQNLISAKELNFSYELANKFVKDISEKLISVKPQKIVEFEKIFKVLPLNFVLVFLVFMLYILPPHIIKESIYKIVFTRKPEVLGIFVFPKDIKVHYKKDCEIKVIVDKSYEFYIPVLFIKTKYSDKFVKVNFDYVERFLNRKIYKYKINSVEEKIFYKIKFRGVNTKTFIIEPILYPEISELKIFVSPPEYTGLKSYEIDSFNATKYFYNSKVKFTGVTNKEIKKICLLFSDDRKKLLTLDKDKKHFYGEFQTTKDVELWFEINDVGDLHNVESIKYKINILEDKHPKIELISPQDEIVVEPTAKIPLVFYCEDDISLSKVELEYYINDDIVKDKKRIKIKEYKPITKEGLEEFFFDLSKIKVNLGETINYYLIVYDNNPYKNQYNITTLRKIEIFSYEKQHKNLLQQIEEFNKKSLDLLSKEIELLEVLSNSKLNVDGLKNLISKHLKTRDDFNRLQEMISSIVKDMTADPYTSFDTYIEFKNIENLVKELNNEILRELVNELENNNLSRAKNLQNQIIDSLGRITNLSQEIVKKQNMQNITEMSKNVKDYGKEILDILKNSTENLSQEERIKLNNLLKEIEDKLKKINDLMKNIPQNLPNEFVNQRDIRNLDFISPMDLIQNIISAVEKNDLSLATNLAESLLSQLDKIAKTLAEISNDITASQTSYLDKELQNLIDNLDEIIKKEDEVYKNTKIIENYRISEVFKKQEQLKNIIKQKINNVINEVNNILTTDEFEKFQKKNLYKRNSIRVIGNLNIIITEIENNILLKSSQLIYETKNIWDENLDLTKNLNIEEYKNLIEKTNSLKAQVDDINKIINSEPEIEYKSEFINQNIGLINEQNNIIKDTKLFKDKLKAFGKKSFLISYEDILITSQSIEAMENSKNFLEKKNFSSALQEQNSAINLLLELRDKFNDKKSIIQQMMNLLGQPMAKEIQYKTFLSRRFGIAEGKVLLPSVKDYEPPKELREDIIKSLSEKYPEDLENIIQEYYKKILK